MHDLGSCFCGFESHLGYHINILERGIIMRKGLLGLILVSMLLIGGCDSYSQEWTKEPRFVTTGQEFTIDNSIKVWVAKDTKTGILYLYDADGDLTPWYNASGLPMKAK